MDREYLFPFSIDIKITKLYFFILFKINQSLLIHLKLSQIDDPSKYQLVTNDSLSNKKKLTYFTISTDAANGFNKRRMAKRDFRILVFWESTFVDRLFICTHSYAIRYACVSVGLRKVDEPRRCDDMGSGLGRLPEPVRPRALSITQHHHENVRPESR